MKKMKSEIDKKYIIFDACSYCYGPAGSLGPIVEELRNVLGDTYRFIFAGYGSSMEVMRKSDFIDEYYELNTESFDELIKHDSFICSSYAIVTNTNPVMAIYAKSKDKKVFFVDILPWMHNAISKKIESVKDLHNNKNYFENNESASELLAQVDTYIYQKYITDFAIDGKYKNIVCIPPISGYKSNKNTHKMEKRLVISTGGLISPDIDSKETLFDFVQVMLDEAIEISRKYGINEIVLCGPEILKKRINVSNGNQMVKVSSLEHNRFLELIACSEYLAIIPGLTTIYEAFLTKNKTLLLPSTNYSQILQSQAICEANLGKELICEEVMGEDSILCVEAGEIEGTKLIIQYIKKYLKEGKIKDIFSMGFDRLFSADKNYELTEKRFNHVINMGENGAKQAADEIVKRLL